MGRQVTFDLPIGARTVWAEARGEPEAGQRAVAHVIVNRLRSNRWGTTLASVCVFRLQFSCWNDSDPNRIQLVSLSENDPAVVTFGGFLEDALRGQDPDATQGALHYYAISIPEPSWAAGKSFTQIGNHRFVRGVA